mgnify:FL=1
MDERTKYIVEKADELIEIAKTKENSTEYLTALLIAATISAASRGH